MLSSPHQFDSNLAIKQQSAFRIGPCFTLLQRLDPLVDSNQFFRGDLERGNVGSLSTSQFIAIFTAIAGVVLFFWFGKKKAQGPEKNIQEEKVV